MIGGFDMDLVAKALASNPQGKRNKTYTREQVDLAVAWLDGMITMKQASDAMEQSRNMYARMSSMLKYGHARGWITVSKTNVD